MIPATVLTGFLGAGKTTLLLDAFRFRPDGERWAVVVNERGAVGIDGAILTAGGVAVREVAGGCVCCTAGLDLRVALVSILRDVRPDRLFVEPSGVARPEGVIDALRSPGMREVVVPRATLCLVDARRLLDRRVTGSDAFQAQIAAADRVIGTHAAEQSATDRERLELLVAASWPPKPVVWTDGAFDAAWLDEVPGSQWRVRSPSAPHDPMVSDGRVWTSDAVFQAVRLELAIQGLVRPGILPRGVDRLKGLFRTDRGWRRVDGTSEALRWTPSSWRGDSRAEILASVGPEEGWEPVWAIVEAALLIG